MRRFLVVFALALTPATLLVTSVQAGEGEGKGEDKGKDKIQVPDSAYVKVTLTRAGKKYAHPGFRIAEREEGVFEIDCDEQLHEVAVAITEVHEKVFAVHVDYIVDGATLLSEDLEVAHTGQAELSKGESKLVLSFDPRGKQDKARKEEDRIKDKPDADDPLGGM